MKVSDYIVKFLVKNGVTDVFGYPGGSVTNLIDSFRKNDGIEAHVSYHEQAAGFAACAYAVTNNSIGVAYATGGPGATNLITAIGHAYYESIPLFCLTGNVNTYEMHDSMPIRQKGFQELEFVRTVKPLVKFAECIKEPEKIRYVLEKAYHYAMNGRKGPVLIDLPMNILREEIEPERLVPYDTNRKEKDRKVVASFLNTLNTMLNTSSRPCFVLGNGAKCGDNTVHLAEFISNNNIPYVTSMIAYDIFPHNKYYFGFLGAYGHRTANIIASKADLIIAIGSRLDIRQVGAKRETFAPNAKILRVDIDEGELTYKVHNDEISFCIDAKDVMLALSTIKKNSDFSEWLEVCCSIKRKLCSIDKTTPNEYMTKLGEILPENVVITTDVGQNQVWVAQSLAVKNLQRVLFSGGMGAMGYSLPAAIGAYYGSHKNHSICICGDGGLQMNIQELQYIVREQLPVKIVVFNNYALGMIRHFQEMYFDNIPYQTKKEGGYLSPSFVEIAKGYGIRAYRITSVDELYNYKSEIYDDESLLLEICIDEDTYIYPKLEFGKPNYDQQPLIDREMLKELLEM